MCKLFLSLFPKQFYLHSPLHIYVVLNVTSSLFIFKFYYMRLCMKVRKQVSGVGSLIPCVSWGSKSCPRLCSKYLYLLGHLASPQVILRWFRVQVQRGWGWCSVAEHLPNQSQALGSIPSTSKVTVGREQERGMESRQEDVCQSVTHSAAALWEAFPVGWGSWNKSPWRQEYLFLFQFSYLALSTVRGCCSPVVYSSKDQR